MMYFNFTTNDGTATQQIYKICTMILYYILVIKLHQTVIKSQTFFTVMTVELRKYEGRGKDRSFLQTLQAC